MRRVVWPYISRAEAPGQTKMRVDESWQSRIITVDISRSRLTKCRFHECFNYVLTKIEYMIVLGKH